MIRWGVPGAYSCFMAGISPTKKQRRLRRYSTAAIPTSWSRKGIADGQPSKTHKSQDSVGSGSSQPQASESLLHRYRWRSLLEWPPHRARPGSQQQQLGPRAASPLVNGNFERGDLTGSSVDTADGGDANVVDRYVYWENCLACEYDCRVFVSPREGSSFALVSSADEVAKAAPKTLPTV